MEYTRLGNSGLVVSRLSLGAMTFTQGDKSLPTIYRVDAPAAKDLVTRALDAGVNFFDTADGYAGGQSEEVLGLLLRARRMDVVIATKVGFRTGAPLVHAGLSRRHILTSVEGSLRRLGTDWIDLYMAHKEDPFTPLEETLEAMDSLVRSGKVRYLGFSNWSSWKAAAALELQRANGWAPFVAGQMHYCPLVRDVERDVVPMMDRYGVAMTVWGALAGGFLTGKYTRGNLGDPSTRLSGFDIIPFDKERGFALVDDLRDIAASRGSTVTRVVLRWLLERHAVASILIGCTKLSQLEDNLGALELELTPADLARIDELTKLPPVYPHWFIDRLVDAPVRDALRRTGAK